MGYLYTFLKPQHAYYAAWQEYRRRRMLAALSFAAWVPLQTIALAAVQLVSRSTDGGGSIATALILPLPVLVVLVANWRFHAWRCPRCGHAFRSRRYWPLSDCCGHCGLEFYAPCNPAEQEWEYEDLVHARRGRADHVRRPIG